MFENQRSPIFFNFSRFRVMRIIFLYCYQSYYFPPIYSWYYMNEITLPSMSVMPVGQQFCKLRASFNNIVSGSVSYIGNFTDRNSENSQKFFPENQTFFLQKQRPLFHPSRYQYTFLYLKVYLIAKQGI